MTLLDYDKILEDVGECGVWQKRLFLLLCFPSAMSSMAVFMYEFIAYTPPHRCFVPECDDRTPETFFKNHTNFSIPKDENGASFCQMYEKENQECTSESFTSGFEECGSWVYDHTLFPDTAVVALAMVCKDEWKKSTAQSVYMAGMLIGSFTFGWVADQVGRKPTLMVSLVFLSFGGSLPSFFTLTPELYYIFVLSRFISGIGHVGTFMVTVSLALEYVGADYRATFGILIEIPFALGGTIVGLLSWAGVRDWRELMLLVSVPNLLMLVYWFYLPESPRWLLTMGRTKEFSGVLGEAALVNKRSIQLNTTQPLNTDLDDKPTKRGGKATFVDLFKPRVILGRSVCLFVNWCITILCYFGLTSIASVLTDDLYLNYTLVGLAEIPACILCVLLMDLLGRRFVFGGCQLLAGSACLLAAVVTGSEAAFLQVPLALVGKFGSSGSMAIMFVYTAELFPTSVRNTAIGLSSMWGRVGGMLAPQVYLLSRVAPALPMTVMGLLSLTGGFMIFLILPETQGTNLPETMEDAIKLGEIPSIRKENTEEPLFDSIS